MNVPYIRLLAFYVVAIIVTVSCTGAPSTAGDYPPVVPSVSSMQLNVSSLNDSMQAGAGQPLEHGHFSRASSLIGNVDSQIDDHLQWAENLLAAVHEVQAKLNNNNRWEWNFTQQVEGQSYPLRLVASRKTENKVNWRFYLVNSQLGMEDQLLISGESHTEGTSGTWVFYERSGKPMGKRAQFSWSLNSEDEVNKKLEILTDRAGRKGDYIEYNFDGKRKTIIYFDAGENSTTEVQKNTESNIGYIYSPTYNEGQQACWNKIYSNISCSEV